MLNSNMPCPRFHLSILNDGSLQTLGVLDVDCLDVAVELLLGVLLVVTLSRDAHAQPVWNTLDALLPHLLVELGVQADVLGALERNCELAHATLLQQIAVVRRPQAWPIPARHAKRTARGESLTMAFSAKALISLMARGALFLNWTPCTYSKPC
jgi:hypothetical protein